VLESEKREQEKDLAGTAKTQLGLAHRTVRCARLDSGEQATLGKLWRRTTIIHRIVRWCTGLFVEPTAASTTVGRAIRGRRVARANGRLGAPDCVRCANQPGVATVGCARNGRKTRTEHEQWLCVYCCGFVCVASQPYSCAFTVIFIVSARDSNLWRFLANGKRYK
jgi:hypothetical protein